MPAGTRLAGVVAAVLLGTLAAWGGDYPAWWTNRTVLAPGVATNDYAVANQGQLKWFVAKAREELEERLPGGAGTTLTSFVSGLVNTQNYVVANQGHVKYAASLVYDRLIAEGYTNAYPWAGAAATNDFAVANIGQVKNLFSFDLHRDSDGDGLADWVETGTGIYVSPWNTGTNPQLADSDGDGANDGSEVAAGLDPTRGNVADTANATELELWEPGSR